jgi:hypothetical protein
MAGVQHKCVLDEGTMIRQVEEDWKMLSGRAIYTVFEAMYCVRHTSDEDYLGKRSFM